MNSTKHKFSNRIVNEQKSNIWEEILQLSGKYGALNLALGFPDFAPPKHIRNALENVSNQSNHMIHHYTRTLGHPRLVKILAKIYSRELQQTLDPMKEVITTIGAYEAMYAAFQALVNPGDEAGNPSRAVLRALQGCGGTSGGNGALCSLNSKRRIKRK